MLSFIAFFSQLINCLTFILRYTHLSYVRQTVDKRFKSYTLEVSVCQCRRVGFIYVLKEKAPVLSPQSFFENKLNARCQVQNPEFVRAFVQLLLSEVLKAG